MCQGSFSCSLGQKDYAHYGTSLSPRTKKCQNHEGVQTYKSQNDTNIIIFFHPGVNCSTIANWFRIAINMVLRVLLDIYILY